ncbi:carbonic anhydrase (plasmid) [Azospirillum sp. B510]|uniref:carbonic anhydrase n=1 Tax=Azospirillum sp. (strain B510) TaxID=137722 RepID=UPI0001C4CA6F|nr:carbonic anhydrase [Azospirillum sp. B510]BAI75793.1 carbonic anhydrase [Azospirillum sp. B510]
MCLLCETAEAGLSRRHLLRTGAALAGTAGALTMAPLAATAKEAAKDKAAPPPPPLSPDKALRRLTAGNARYAANTARNRDYSVGRAARAAAQFPFAAIVSCADSRVSPEILFDQGPGDLFVVRVAGNFVNDDGLASLEYGVKMLNIPLILVLGHSGCGAIGATIKAIQDGAQLPGHLPGLVDALKPGVEAAIARKPADLMAEATMENVRHNVRRLADAQPIVAPMVADSRVRIVGGLYDIATGKVGLL